MSKFNDDIAREIKSCTNRNTYQPSKPMYERGLPSAPWEMQASDLFDQKDLLICNYYYSEFLIVRKLSECQCY